MMQVKGVPVCSQDWCIDQVNREPGIAGKKLGNLGIIHTRPHTSRPAGAIPLWAAKPVTSMSRTKRMMASGRTSLPIMEKDFFTSHRAMVAMSVSVLMSNPFSGRWSSLLFRLS
ncbi:MAG: hypothetical protein MZV49_19700 [Rhodopseudomonas palustris]|nr:hypothetical protein [Rhodopseudomonas palustris]